MEKILVTIKNFIQKCTLISYLLLIEIISAFLPFVEGVTVNRREIETFKLSLMNIAKVIPPLGIIVSMIPIILFLLSVKSNNKLFKISIVLLSILRLIIIAIILIFLMIDTSGNQSCELRIGFYLSLISTISVLMYGIKTKKN